MSQQTLNEEEFTSLQLIVYDGLMQARLKPDKDLLEILDETVDWIEDEHHVLNYKTGTATGRFNKSTWLRTQDNQEKR